MKKLGVLGGAFDPIHCGHIQMANIAAEFFDEVWIMPAYRHAFNKPMTSYEDRLEMCGLAIQSEFANEKINVSDFERHHSHMIPDDSTYEVMHFMQWLFRGKTELTIIIGQDNADCIEKWKHHQKLLREFNFLVLPRAGSPQPACDVWYILRKDAFLINYKAANEIAEYSSTLAREAIHDGKRPEQVPEMVLDYISKKQLYKML